MAPTNQSRSKWLIALLSILVFIGLLVLAPFRPISALALGDPETSVPVFQEFKESVMNGNAATLRGVYISGVLEAQVVQQPDHDAGYVSQDPKVITQFGMVTDTGNVGLLAHNNLAGKNFSNLSLGQMIHLVYGDGRVESFKISEISSYQALRPYDPTGSFLDLQTNQVLDANALFSRMYRGKRHVTLQTCIDANGDPSWGRLFIIAFPN
jgi:hypothetical protein